MLLIYIGQRVTHSSATFTEGLMGLKEFYRVGLLFAMYAPGDLSYCLSFYEFLILLRLFWD